MVNNFGCSPFLLINTTMKPTLRLIFSAVGFALSIAVLVILIISKEPNLKSMVLLLALGVASQGLATFDQIGEKEEQKEDSSQS